MTRPIPWARRVPMLLVLLHASSTALAAVIYVDADAPGADNGATWPDAYGELHPALTAAQLGDEIWVARGTYTPDFSAGFHNGNRAATFQLKSGVALYGGFLGNAHPDGGETLRAQRRPGRNLTLLSGQIGNLASDFDNSYHVVTATGVDNTAVLDGFIITKGRADDGGGGLFCQPSGSPTIVGCTFLANTSISNGGAIRFQQGNTRPVLINCVFSGNASTTGRGGAIYCAQAYPTLTNCTFSHNTAGTQGGAIYNVLATSTITNSIFWNNADAGGTGQDAQIFNGTGGAATVTYTIVQDDDPNDADIFPGMGNLDDDPLFALAAGLDGIPGTLDDHLHLFSPSSPAIDAGNNNADTTPSTPLDPLPDTDAWGLPRFLDDPAAPDTGAGTPPIVDLGALEGDGDCNANSLPDILDPNADLDDFIDDCDDCTDTDGVGFGNPGFPMNTCEPDNCPDTFNPDQSDADLDGIGDVCEPDCDGDGTIDDDEFANCTGEPECADCNTNGVPDACDPGFDRDCNGNGVSDICEPDDDGDGFINDCDNPARLLVNVNATGANNGFTWADAYVELQSALVYAAEHPGEVDEIWVAAGTYLPDFDVTTGTHTLDQNMSFQLVSGVALYGGFAGDETAVDQRDFTAHETTLSGDLGALPGRRNAWHVLTANHAVETGWLNGLTVAQASGPDFDGGGLLATGARLTLTRCKFHLNRARDGGAIANIGGHLEVANCVFGYNPARFGQAVFNRDGATAKLANCVILAFSVQSSVGVAIANDGSQASIVNCTLSGDTPTVANYAGELVVTNSIIWTAGFSLSNPLIETTRGTTLVNYSTIQDDIPDDGVVWPGEGNLDSYPIFQFGVENLRLQPGSPAIDAGTNIVPLLPAIDLDGNPRIQGCFADMGAYEFPDPATCLVARHVFYNDSYYDTPGVGCDTYVACGGIPGCGEVCSDDTAIDTSKTALLPGGGTATFANYIKGINGLMIDVAGRDESCGDITAADFIFTNTGRDGPDPDEKSCAGIACYKDRPAAVPASVTTRLGEGAGGSDRIVITWDNPNGATGQDDMGTPVPFPNNKNAWLQVEALANANTCLADPDVFWFGVAQGEGNLANTAVAFPVAAGDMTATRDCATQAPGACGNPLTNPKPVTEPLDYDKDGQISQAADFDVARENPAVSAVAQALRAITP